jgi:plastocyanin
MSLAHIGGWTGGAWAFLVIFLALLVVGLIIGIARLFAGGRGSRAGEILDERLASGEIGPEEHRDRLAAIRRSRGAAPLLGPLALALTITGLVGSLVVAAVAPGRGHGFMHMRGGMGSMMMRGESGRSGSPPAAGAPNIRVAGSEFSFNPREVRLRSGETVNIEFENRGMMFHTLTVGELGLDLRANGGDSISGSLRPQRPGTYPFLCSVPGHADAGMRGTISVE